MVCLCVCTHACVCVCVRACMHVCVFVCTRCVFVYHTHVPGHEDPDITSQKDSYKRITKNILQQALLLPRKQNNQSTVNKFAIFINFCNSFFLSFCLFVCFFFSPIVQTPLSAVKQLRELEWQGGEDVEGALMERQMYMKSQSALFSPGA